MSNLCMHCMKNVGVNLEICPNCGKSIDGCKKKLFLTPKTELVQRYIVGDGVDMDSESLMYVGFDNSKEQKIYIKEFFPSKFCYRSENEAEVKSRKGCDKFFKSLKFDFTKYFKSVARIRNLFAVVSVYDVFEQNGTVYVVFEYIEGTRLDEFVENNGGALSWGLTRRLFMPFVSSLSHMEVSGVRHLGICPKNIFVTKDNKLKLAGFSTKNTKLANSSIECYLHEACSALEQYSNEYDISETTDVYGLAATMFFVLSGEYPLPVVKREQDDRLMMPRNIIENLPENVVSALASALRIYPNVRTISLEAFRVELSDSPVLKIQDIEEFDNEEFDYKIDKKSKENKNQQNSVSLGMISCVFALVLLLVCFGVYWFWLRGSSLMNGVQNSQDSIQNIFELNNSTNETVSDQEQKTGDEGGQKIVVPNLIEKNYKKLQQTLEASSTSEYKLVMLGEDFSDSVAQGDIISQSPSAGEEMAKGSTIAVNVSKGSKKRSLPNITGKTLSEASNLIAGAKLTPVSTLEFSEEYEEGVVIGYKDYAAGDKVDYGATVTIVVSRGTK